MKIHIGSDHAGVELKELIKKHFDGKFEFEDEGTSVVHYNPIVYIPRKELNLNASNSFELYKLSYPIRAKVYKKAKNIIKQYNTTK